MMQTMQDNLALGAVAGADAVEMDAEGRQTRIGILSRWPQMSSVSIENPQTRQLCLALKTLERLRVKLLELIRIGSHGGQINELTPSNLLLLQYVTRQPCCDVKDCFRPFSQSICYSSLAFMGPDWGQIWYEVSECV